MSQSEYFDFSSLSLDRLVQEVLTLNYGYTDDNGWKSAFVNNPQGWKLHVFIDTVEDWVQVSKIILPYLHYYRIGHKTADSVSFLERINQHPEQKGKVYTIYADTVITLKQTIFDLDQFLMLSGAYRWDHPHIYGDRLIGDSYRVFYRYDKDIYGNYRLNDGTYKPEGLSDPFIYFGLEKAIASLLPGESLVLGGMTTSPGNQDIPYIFRTEQAFLLQNVNAGLDMFVNGVHIVGEAVLQAGDSLKIQSYTPFNILRPYRAFS